MIFSNLVFPKVGNVSVPAISSLSALAILIIVSSSAAFASNIEEAVLLFKLNLVNNEQLLGLNSR